MGTTGKTENIKTESRSLLAAKKWLLAIVYVALIGNLVLQERKEHSGFLVFSIVLLSICICVILLPMRFLLWTGGPRDYVEISDVAFEQRLRKRYGSEIDQLTSLGFCHLFFEGETTSVFRLFFIFPAIVKLMMLLHRAVITIGPGWKFVGGNPVLASGDKTAFACVGSLGVKFRTAFKDGTILESQTYGNDNMPSGPTIVRHCFKGESVPYTWEQHKKWIQTLETDSNPVVRDLSFQAWVGLIRRVSADLREHL